MPRDGSGDVKRTYVEVEMVMRTRCVERRRRFKQTRDGLRIEKGWSGMAGRRIEEEHCAQRNCALRGIADQQV